MDNEKAKRIRNAYRAFLQKTIKGTTTILVEQTADHLEDSSREKLMRLKFPLNERLETIQMLASVLARIDLTLENAKNSGHAQNSPSFIQGNNNVKSDETTKVKLPKLELKIFRQLRGIAGFLGHFWICG